MRSAIFISGQCYVQIPLAKRCLQRRDRSDLSLQSQILRRLFRPHAPLRALGQYFRPRPKVPARCQLGEFQESQNAHMEGRIVPEELRRPESPKKGCFACVRAFIRELHFHDLTEVV